MLSRKLIILNIYLKKLEKKEYTKLKINKRKKITKRTVEIVETEIKPKNKDI